jgi:hypothetical protein
VKHELGIFIALLGLGRGRRTQKNSQKFTGIAKLTTLPFPQNIPPQNFPVPSSAGYLFSIKKPS